MSNAALASVGKPKIGGAVYAAPIGTALPTDATSALDGAFQCLGYCSEDGLVNSNSPESDTIKAWGGDTVINLETGRNDTFQYTLLEILNVLVAQFVYGVSNVTGDLSTGVAITVNNKEMEEHSIVVDMVLKGNILKRIVIPCGKVTELGDITYSDSAAIGYQTTVSCTPDTAGNYHYEYSKQVSSTATYTVTFNSNGGTAVASQAVASGGKATQPTAPTRTGYTFGGWYKEATLTTAWTFGTDTVSANTVLYAKWTENV